ncbi:hypothetical protein BJF80_07050 [Serinicoccus sp. CUA-874]|uniref:septation protein SepH n=1 Tax=Serinicoccus sp. CUA-874 TaxID=1517939 RepID=UPI000964D9D1|nr:septation protein SepH [Serinicoccus sp. CUA-874]OLT16327.1 hypothetical protein BJF80_07050 [Serinicoccus sp. CUA-874]
MQQLQFVELDEGGRLVLTGDDGSQYAVRVDDRLRAALRPRSRQAESEGAGRRAVSPRDVQAMIRAGQPAEDVAASTGWELERVRRFEGPVLAEREHVVGLAQRAPVRASGRTDGSHTLDRRVRERLQSRGVDLTAVSWDAARGEPQEPWTVIVAFGAGGRERRAAWHYDVRSRAVEALDDEARWLSEDEQALPGGLSGHPLLGGSHGEDEAAADLMATMRERRQRRGRRTQPAARQGADDPGHVPGQREMPGEVLPLEDLPYDPGTMGDPPAAHPRGSAPESPSPVGPTGDEPVEDPVAVEPAPEVAAGPDVVAEPEVVEEPEVVAEPGPEEQPEPVTPEEARRAVGRGKGRKRRRLRLPSVAPAAHEEEGVEAEGSFARTRHDPQEVTFDEFFGMEDDDLDVEEGQPQQDDLHEPDGDDESAAEERDGDGELLEDEVLIEDEAFEGADSADEPAAAESQPEDVQKGEPGPEAEGVHQEEPTDDVGDGSSSDDASEEPVREEAAADQRAAAPLDDEVSADHGIEEPVDEESVGEESVSEESVGEESVGEESVSEEADAEPSSSDDAPQEHADEEAAADQVEVDDAVEEDAPEEPAAKPTSGRKGRTSVPSWDDIMFGSRPPRG